LGVDAEHVAVELCVASPGREVYVAAERLRHLTQGSGVFEELLGPVFEAVEVTLISLLEALHRVGDVVGVAGRADVAQEVGE
jgi:hypothetical protein